MVYMDYKIRAQNIVIHKRTFEGKTDTTKNDCPITSKYYPSKKYAVAFDLLGYKHNPVVHCFKTKKDALAYAVLLRGGHS